ncbi:heme NO-binding domain-containing protein [Mucilaginibacter sp. RS28]|uniref:Heme NO-binding domain-containing protein n=1 Tax=Mucilaginibacter straminoryzae TaxID=2932774 RepID=A0A9X2BA37_9SPHI|nr:heme NO-binding domain-containing protein [Mucilaginibacter straminoryzae]
MNKAIEDLVISNFGREKWEAVKERSGVEVDFFIGNQPYADEVTYKLAQAVSDEMEMPQAEVLQAFGEWWVLKTGKEKYGGLMQAGGQNLKEFLINLPEFHNRIMLIYTRLTPPEFQVTDIEENSLHLHYFSKRQGLQEFVRGLISGLGKMYDCPVTIELIESRLAGHDHEVFKVNW